MTNFQHIPFNDIIRFGQRTMLSKPLFTVSWVLGRFCNYKCSYCWKHARSDVVDHKSLSIYKTTMDEIKKQARANGFTEFHWSFSGGEPTTYKNLLELIAYIDDGPTTPYQSVHMTTNLSPGIKWWRKWCKSTELLQRRSISASFHEEFADENDFSNKVLELMHEDVFVTVNQVMVPSKFYELYNRMARLHKKGINVTLKPQSDITATRIVDGYTPEMIEILKEGFPQMVHDQELYQIALYDKDNIEYLFDQAERFNAFGFNKFTNWTCNAGFQGIIIRENEVKRSHGCNDKILGTLDAGFKIFNEPKLCNTPQCLSSADSKIPKKLERVS